MTTTRTTTTDAATEFALRVCYHLAREEWNGARVVAEASAFALRLERLAGLPARGARAVTRLALTTALEALFGAETANSYAAQFDLA